VSDESAKENRHLQELAPWSMYYALASSVESKKGLVVQKTPEQSG